MARVPRSLTVRESQAVHKVWRGHNREPNLGGDHHKNAYLDFLNADLESQKYKQGQEITAMTLMSNHTHEMYQIISPELFSNHMRRHHSRYGAYFNKLENRCGKVAQDRPHTTLIEDSQHEMETVFYIHANPVRAGIVGDARDYLWSTHRWYAFGKKALWMRNFKLPDWYQKLGRTLEQRQRAYRRLFARYLELKGRFKQNFLKKRFFGSPVWCDRKERAVTDWRRGQNLDPPD